MKKSARNGPAPERLRPARVGFEDPDLVQAPRPWCAAHRVAIIGVGGLLRPAWRGDLLPGLPPIAGAVQPGPQVPLSHGRPERPPPRHDRGGPRPPEPDARAVFP